MNCKYSLTQKVYFDGENPHVSYGIKVTDGTETLAEIDDISTDKEKVNSLVARCNSMKLSAVHLFEVVEDIL